MLIPQLNSEQTAADKVPIAIGIGTEPHRWGPISMLTFSAGRLSPHSTGKSNYLEQGREPVASVIHFEGHSLVWLDAPILQHSHAPAHVPLATAQCPAVSCHWLFWWDQLRIFDRHWSRIWQELYSPSLHRTETSGTAPNPPSEHISSHPLLHIFDYPGNNQPLIQHNLLPMNLHYLLILLYLAWADDYCAWLYLPYPLSSHPQQSQGSAIVLPPSSQSYSAEQDQAHQLLL